jgi:hypothetical protein
VEALVGRAPGEEQRARAEQRGDGGRVAAVGGVTLSGEEAVEAGSAEKTVRSPKTWVVKTPLAWRATRSSMKGSGLGVL